MPLLFNVSLLNKIKYLSSSKIINFFLSMPTKTQIGTKCNIIYSSLNILTQLLFLRN